MTNRVFKDYHKNKPIIDAANETVNVMCIVLLTANKLFPKIMYPKAICTFLDDRTEYCNISDEYEQLDVFDYKMQQACDSIGVDTDDCRRIVEKFMHPVNNNVKDVYINNVRLLFIQLHREHGLGQERRVRLVAALLSDQAEIDRPLERIKEMGGDIDITTISSVDYRKYRKKPEKVSYKEHRQAIKDLQALKAYQDSILKEGG
jgi:hypothetical protein